MFSGKRLDYGPVVILKGPHKGRIGNYDDDDIKAIIYFGSMFLCPGWYEIPHKYLRPANTTDLINRRAKIDQELGLWSEAAISVEEKYYLLLEKSWIDGILNDNIIELWFGKDQALKGTRVFLSHSSKDKQFVNRIATDLAKLNVAPWLDSWHIRAGESIPQKISSGIKDSECVVVFLSKNAVASHWVEREWQAKYWDEIQRNQVLVIPALMEDCEIPQLLRAKKYADFREDYDQGLQELLLALSRNTRSG
jgi:hypothetical protein